MLKRLSRLLDFTFPRVEDDGRDIQRAIDVLQQLGLHGWKLKGMFAETEPGKQVITIEVVRPVKR